jgi:predicted component of type VI protein secretion system
MRFIRKAGAPAEDSPKRLHVEPAELARKLVKEMDDHAATRGNEVWVRNRYTIYLCREDYENLAQRASQIIPDLKHKLAKHIESMDYLIQGDLIVELALDEELELGYFGILAQKGGARQAQREMEDEAFPASAAPMGDAPMSAAPAGAAPRSAPPASSFDDMPASNPAARLLGTPGADAGPSRVPPAQAGPSGPLSARAAAAAEAAAAAAARAAAARPPVAQAPGRMEVMPGAQAADMGLEGRVIIVTAGEEVLQFRQARVIVGRSKEADVQVDDPNVSRKHAAIYWNNGRIMIDDLGSTNGTMVNGYPVTRTMLRPTDIVAIGESRLTVEGR